MVVLPSKSVGTFGPVQGRGLTKGSSYLLSVEIRVAYSSRSEDLLFVIARINGDKTRFLAEKFNLVHPQDPWVGQSKMAATKKDQKPPSWISQPIYPVNKVSEAFKFRFSWSITEKVL